MTPAQAYGHPSFADDYPWDGGYGEGERRSACRNAQEITAPRPGGPCSGLLPAWIRNYPSGMLSGISLNGRPVPGFGIGQAAGDVFATLTPTQQAWIQQTLSTLHSKIITQTQTTCPGWAEPTANLAAAVACFQLWANNLSVPLTGGGALRQDGVLDQATLTSLLSAAIQHPEDFSTTFPQPAAAPPAVQAAVNAAVAAVVPPVAAAPVPAPVPGTQPSKGLSTGAMVGIGIAAVGAIGTGVYFATRGGGGKKRRKRRKR